MLGLLPNGPVLKRSPQWGWGAFSRASSSRPGREATLVNLQLILGGEWAGRRPHSGYRAVIR